MDSFLFISKVPEKILKKSFLRAYLFATLASVALLLPLILSLSLKQSSPCFFCFFFLIALGFRSYKKLERVKNHPHHLIVCNKGIRYKEELFPFSFIKKIHHINDGIEIIYEKQTRFFPYFTKEDFEKIIRLSEPFFDKVVQTN